MLEVYTRDDPSFIQGLYFDVEKQQLLESTGLEGISKTQWLNINDQSQRIEQTDIVVPYQGNQFGEGISYLDEDSWIELTWKDGVVNILDRDSLELVSTLPMWDGVTTGWGITLDP